LCWKEAFWLASASVRNRFHASGSDPRVSRRVGGDGVGDEGDAVGVGVGGFADDLSGDAAQGEPGVAVGEHDDRQVTAGHRCGDLDLQGHRPVTGGNGDGLDRDGLILGLLRGKHVRTFCGEGMFRQWSAARYRW
jgi:hypothetical protein